MEEWKQVDGFENYSISNLGNVRNNVRHYILKGSPDKDGYLNLSLFKSKAEKDLLNIKGHSEKKVKVHRLVALHFIARPNEEFIEVDHINRNKSDNRVENLRWVNKSLNGINKVKPKGLHTSKYKGVYFDKCSNRWKTRICVNKVTKWIGTFKTEQEAAQSYNQYIINNKLTEHYILNIF